MKKEELKEYVASLSEEIKEKFKENEIEHKQIQENRSFIELSMYDDFDISVKEMKDILSKFQDDDRIHISHHTGYYDDVSIDSKIEVNRLETDDELTQRIMDKVNRLTKKRNKPKK